MIKYNKIQVKCIDLNEKGEGIVINNKKIINVPNLLPHETAIIDTDGNSAKMIKLLKISKERQDSQCSAYHKCGSCQLLHMNYDSQIEFKKKYVLSCFKKENIPFKIKQIITAEDKLGYRNKMQVAFKYKEGKVVYGFFEEGSHRVISIDECIVQTKEQNLVVREMQKIMTKLKITPYDEDKRRGVIRFALVKQAFVTKQVMLVIVTNGEVFPARNEFLKMIKEKCPFITTIIQNVNERKTSVILGDQERILFGDGFIEDYLCGVLFKITSKSFFQINPVQTEKLYSKIVEMGKFTKEEEILDAYSGVGTIGIILSKYVKNVISVESNKQAVMAAIKNTKDNNIKNVRCYNEDATVFIEKLAKERYSLDAVIMDPPRAGSTDKFLKALTLLKPKKIIYVSCEASTLARDLKLLVKDYSITDTAIVDLFVGTYHIETIVLLERVTSK